MAALFSGCGHESSLVAPLLQPAPAGPPPCAGLAQYYCDAWQHCRPQAATATFDLLVSGAGGLDAIRQAGGTVLHEFNVPLVRATLPVDAVPTLWHDRWINHAREVAPESPFEFEGLIVLPLPLSTADREFLELSGVSITYESRALIVARIPDAAVPTIRNHPGVRFVEANGYECGDASF
jgi:hypothetical protein